MPVKVSLYIPCFNAEKTISTCLDAVFKQARQPEEVIIVDDGSGDNTLKIASAYPVRVIRHEDNLGLAVARNTAINNTSSDLVASLDADCQPDREWLAFLINRISASDIAGAGGKLTEEASSVFDLWRAEHMKQHWEEESKNPPFLFGSNTVFKRSALLEAGLYNEKLRNNYEDVDICERLVLKGYRFVYEPKAVAHHLKNDNFGSLLNTYWQWNFAYSQKQGFYSDKERFFSKIKDNIGLANRYLEEDIAHGKKQLLYLDFLLAAHHSLKDLEYYFNKEGLQCRGNNLAPALWASFLDLAFFCHWNRQDDKISTFLPRSNSPFQNYLVSSLLLGNIVERAFGDNMIRQFMIRDLLASTYKVNDNILAEKMLKQGQDWQDFLKKEQQNLNKDFLEKLSSAFSDWIKSLTFNFPGISKWLEDSANKTVKSLDMETEAVNGKSF